jgi:chromosome segregation ATPase
MSGSASSPAVTSLKNHMVAVKKELDELVDKHRSNTEQLDVENAKQEELNGEMASINRKVEETEADYADLSARLQAATLKMEETVKAADEFERGRRALDHRRNMDEERLAVLEQMLKETSDAAYESDKKFDEVSRKLLMTEAELEKAESKTEGFEAKAKQIQEDMHALTSKLKSFQSTVEKFGEREDKYERTIEDLKARIKNAANHASNSDETVAKLQREADHLNGELNQSRKNYQSLREELNP